MTADEPERKDRPMSYADEVAPMPERSEDTTMDGLIRAYLANAEKGIAATRKLFRPAFADDRSEADLLRYVLHLHTWLWQAEVADLLMRIQKLAPAEDADRIAGDFVNGSHDEHGPQHRPDHGRPRPRTRIRPCGVHRRRLHVPRDRARRTVSAADRPADHRRTDRTRLVGGADALPDPPFECSIV